MNFSAAKAEEAFSISSPNFFNGGGLSKENEFSGFGCAQAVLGPMDICTSNNNRFIGLDCNGKNKAPTITWSNAPAKAKSFAFSVFDPDMPTGTGWWHFLAYNITTNIHTIEDGKLPAGAIAAVNDSGTKYYMGPCPPRNQGKHRYVFTVYALDVDVLDVPQNATANLVAYAILQHRIASAAMIGSYGR